MIFRRWKHWILRFLERRNALDVAQQVTFLVGAGDSANRRRAWREAADAYGNALKLDSALSAIWVQYGHSLKEQGLFEDAEKAYRRSLAIDWDVADTHLQLGHVLKEQDRREEMVAAYRIAARIDPHDLRIRLELDALKEGDGSVEAAATDVHNGLLHNGPVLRTAIGRIEAAGTPGILGGIVVGWAINRGPADIMLVTENGAQRSLTDSIRFHREDVVRAHEGEFGRLTAESGFVCALPGEFRPGNTVSLIETATNDVVKLCDAKWSFVSTDPIKFAQWAFALPTPFSQFVSRLDGHDGWLIEGLISSMASYRPRSASIWSFGPSPKEPSIAVIIPLYARTDFVEHQLIAFADDADFSGGRVELIFVLDDPRIVEQLLGEAPLFAKLYGVGFRVLWGGVNRGFSGANNLGASHAHGRTLIFLNSDVFPQSPGQFARLADSLNSQPDFAALGARLNYPDGGIQHLGMRFELEPAWSVWLNKHPGQGFPFSGRMDKIIEVQAATGACLAVRRTDFESIGGFDEGYLIGDFEDSDLCLRLRQLGKIGVLTDSQFVHLERQSVRMLGEGEFRQKVVLFNAWRHARRHHDRIAEILSES